MPWPSLMDSVFDKLRSVKTPEDLKRAQAWDFLQQQGIYDTAAIISLLWGELTVPRSEKFWLPPIYFCRRWHLYERWWSRNEDDDWRVACDRYNYTKAVSANYLVTAIRTFDAAKCKACLKVEANDQELGRIPSEIEIASA